MYRILPRWRSGGWLMPRTSTVSRHITQLTPLPTSCTWLTNGHLRTGLQSHRTVARWNSRARPILCTRAGPPSLSRCPLKVDRIYQSVPNQLQIIDRANSSTVLISKSDEWQDAVVWNPWIEKSKGMADLPDEAYHNFVCVEVARTTASLVTLPAKSSWSASVEYQLCDLQSAI